MDKELRILVAKHAVANNAEAIINAQMAVWAGELTPQERDAQFGTMWANSERVVIEMVGKLKSGVTSAVVLAGVFGSGNERDPRADTPDSITQRE